MTDRLRKALAPFTDLQNCDFDWADQSYREGPVEATSSNPAFFGRADRVRLYVHKEDLKELVDAVAEED